MLLWCCFQRQSVQQFHGACHDIECHESTLLEDAAYLFWADSSGIDDDPVHTDPPDVLAEDPYVLGIEHDESVSEHDDCIGLFVSLEPYDFLPIIQSLFHKDQLLVMGGFHTSLFSV